MAQHNGSEKVAHDCRLVFAEKWTSDGTPSRAGSDWADNASLFGSDSGGFEYASDDYSTGSGQQRVNATATVARGAGYLVGSAVKAVLVGARSLAGWLTRRNMARQ